MKKKILPQLLGLYYTFRKSPENLLEDEDVCVLKYKIGNSYANYKLSGKIQVQSRKGSAYLLMTPEKIVADNDIISYFHPIDACIITKLSLKEKTAQKYSIDFTDDINDLVHVEVIETGDIRVMNYIDLFKNKNIILGVSNEEAFSLGSKHHEIHLKRIAKIKRNLT